MSIRLMFLTQTKERPSIRVIRADALRFMLILQEPRGGQERKQDSEDDPDINAHQSSPAAALPTNSSLTDPLWSTPLSGRGSCANRIGIDQTVFVLISTRVGELSPNLGDGKGQAAAA